MHGNIGSQKDPELPQRSTIFTQIFTQGRGGGYL